MTVFRDEAALDFDFVPKELPGREHELELLMGLCKGIEDSIMPINCFIKGGAGIGKTAVAKRVAENLGVDYVYINCRMADTQADALARIIHHYDTGYSLRGIGVGEKWDAVRRKVKDSGRKLLVIVDEIEEMEGKDGDKLVYGLNRINEPVKAAKDRVVISQCLISRKNEPRDILASHTLSRFGRRNVLTLKKYTEEQLRKIIEYRIELAFFSECVADDCNEMITEITNKEGDVRRAIEILWRAGKAADEEAKMRDLEYVVMPEHIRRASAFVDTWLPPWEFEEMDAHNLYLLTGVAHEVKDVAAVSGEEVRNAYELVCEEHGVKPLAKSTFYGNLDELGKRDVVHIKKKGREKRVSLLAIAAKDLEEIIERALKVHRRT